MELTTLVMYVVLNAGNSAGLPAGKEVPMMPWPVATTAEYCEELGEYVAEAFPKQFPELAKESYLHLTCMPMADAERMIEERYNVKPEYSDMEGRPLVDMAD